MSAASDLAVAARADALDRLRVATRGMRVALVHEWLSAPTGSEQTFAAMARLLPNAELFALSHNRSCRLDFGDRKVRTSALDARAQRGGRAALLPLMPTAMRRLAWGQTFDVVVTSSHAFSRAFAADQSGIHLSYTYTPVRYVWYPELERQRSRIAVPAAVLRGFQALDRRHARGVRSFAAISSEVQHRIQQCYGRPSTVVHPPCDVDFFTPPPIPLERNGAIIAGRLVSYKRVDLAIRACAATDIDLTVIGEGPERHALEALAETVAPGRVHFAGRISRARLRDAYRSAAVVLFPAVEDFGIVPVEAQACGAPVVAIGAGGALETVLAHSGAFAPYQEVDPFAAAIRLTIDSPPASVACREHAARFSTESFERAFAGWVIDGLGDAAGAS